jgi:hypothetical protein
MAARMAISRWRVVPRASKEVRQVLAGEEQEQRHGAGQEEERGPCLADEIVLQRHETHGRRATAAEEVHARAGESLKTAAPSASACAIVAPSRRRASAENADVRR